MASTEILELIERHTSRVGITETPFEGVQLFRVCAPVQRVPGVYMPSLCVIAQGSKRAYFGGDVHTYDPSHYLCATAPTPVEAEILHASPDAPVLGMLISLRSKAMTELMIDHQRVYGQVELPSSRDGTPGLVVARWGADFERALLQLLELLDSPDVAGVLGNGRLRELFFAILQGSAGPSIRHALGGSHTLSQVIDHIHQNLHEPFSIDELAGRARMSRPAFDRAFRAATTHSPLQFIKALRLANASMLIAQGVSVGEAAERVGYMNRSQFSREFRRKFGLSPRDWKHDTTAAVADLQATA